MSSDRIIHITDATFEDKVLNSDKPVLVDYWAEWCGPCRLIAPILDEIADEYDGKLTVAKLDTDKNQATAMRFGVRGIPTLIVFSGGKETAREVGAVPRQRLDALLR